MTTHLHTHNDMHRFFDKVIPPLLPWAPKPKPAPTLTNKVAGVALRVLTVLTKIGFYLSNSNLFALGFVAGVAWGDKVEQIIERMKGLWKYHSWPMKLTIVTGTFLAFPVSFATTIFLVGAHTGSRCYQAIQSQQEFKMPSKTP